MNEKCNQYLLKKFLVRIDFTQAQDLDIDGAIQKVRKSFYEDEYKLYQNMVPLTSVEAEMPLPNGQMNQMPHAMHIINESIKEYVLKKDFLAIKFSNQYLIIEDQINNDYKGSAFYVKIIKELMSALYDINPFIHLQRIGLRKFDSLIFKEISNINKYFDKSVFNQQESLEKYNAFGKIFSDSSSRFSIISEDKKCRANIITDVQSGEYHEDRPNGESGQAIQAVLDIDMYKDNFDEEYTNFTDYIIDIYTTLNEESYNIYKSALTIDFYNALHDGTVEDSDILGGIYEIQFCD